jgi:hypothetical protein
MHQAIANGEVALLPTPAVAAPAREFNIVDFEEAQPF